MARTAILEKGMSGLHAHHHHHGHSHGDPREQLRVYMERHGLKTTVQRQVVLDTFLESEGHMSLEELHQMVRERNPSVGYTTVYRTMKLLTDAGVAHARSFSGNSTLFELASEHHDHLICESCGRIVEFENERIEELQQLVAESHGFTIESHKMELYGLCGDCQKSAQP